MDSALAINSRLIAAGPARFSFSVSKSASKDCGREVSAALRRHQGSLRQPRRGRLVCGEQREPRARIGSKVPQWFRAVRCVGERVGIRT